MASASGECKGECKKGQIEVDNAVRKSGYVDSSYSIDKFEVITNGYRIRYVSGQIVILLELDWNLNLLRRDTQVTTTSTSTTTTQSTSSNIQLLISQYITHVLPQYFSHPSIQSIDQIGTATYKISILLPINSRSIKYELILGQSNSQFQIQDTRYVIDFVPTFKTYVPETNDIKATLDQIIKEELIKKGGQYVLPNDVTIWDI